MLIVDRFMSSVGVSNLDLPVPRIIRMGVGLVFGDEMPFCRSWPQEHF